VDLDVLVPIVEFGFPRVVVEIVDGHPTIDDDLQVDDCPMQVEMVAVEFPMDSAVEVVVAVVVV